MNEIEVRSNSGGRHQSHSQENKRMSLQEPYYMNNDLQMFRQGNIIDSEKDIDEAEERQRYGR